ncbi:ATP-binding protein [Aureispira sp. CCB-E]|uniref:hybrid sensor histidine kinase/response regulator transcription factor n=1 Tax=Aureispira sp. CCB-E TaxID=3051121 RepID=UPI0028696071|nr:ATP-binding protein [Aureispira sp. CCB-E]WMX14911.1 response regulator [Aureispira sp. CCB-E]
MDFRTRFKVIRREEMHFFVTFISSRNLIFLIFLKKFNLYILFQFVVFCSHAQPLSTVLKQYIVQQQELSTEDGLSHPFIHSFAQDNYGFMWLATPYGLNRYNGQEFKQYHKKDFALRSNNVRLVISAPDSMLWLAYTREMEVSHAIDVFDPISGAITPLNQYFSKSLPFDATDIHFRSFRKNADGNIWFSTPHDLYQYNGSKIEHLLSLPDSFTIRSAIPYEEKAASGWLTAISETSNHYLFHFNERKKIIEQYPLAEPQGPRTTINLIKALDRQGIIYSTTQLSKDSISKNVLFYKANHQSPQRFIPTVDKDYLLYKYAPYHNQIWCFGTEGKIDLYSTQAELVAQCTTTVFQSPPSHLFFDIQGGLWVNTKRKNYLLHVVPNPFKRYSGNTTSHQFGVSCRGIAEDTTGRLYLNSRTGTYQTKDRTQQMQRLPNIPNYPVDMKGKNGGARLATLVDDDESIWLTGEYRTLIHYHPETSAYDFFLYDSLDELRLSQHKIPPLYWSLYKDYKGQIWLGGIGLSYLDATNKKLKLWDNYNGFYWLATSEIYHFHENQTGIWLASSSGLYHLDKNMHIKARYHTKGKPPYYLPADVITHLHEDKEGNFWLTTKGNGLVKWHPNSKVYKHFTTRHGLTHDVLYAVYEDAHNHLWLSSNMGIMSFDKATHIITPYSTKDGLPQKEFNTISHYQAHDGTIFFGGLNGLISFHPTEIQQTKRVYKAALHIISHTKYDNQKNETIDLTAACFKDRKIVVQPQDRNVQLGFRLLDYRNQAPTFFYRIVGLDPYWRATQKTEINLDGLPYGNYDLHIKTEASDQLLKIALEVVAPFYFRPWFVACSIILILCIIALVIWFRTQALEKRKRMLEAIVVERTAELKIKTLQLEAQTEELKGLNQLKSRFFTNISHELRTPLTLILAPLAALIKNKKKNDLEKQQLKMIERNGMQLLQLVEEILDLSKLEANKLEVNEQPTALNFFASRILTTFKSRALFLDLDYTIEVWVDQEQIVLLDQDKVAKILNNFISNAFKFTSPKDKVNARVVLDMNKIIFSVKDTGQGVAKEDLPFLFDRFYQTNQAQNRADGTGIGLAFCKELAELMGGVVKVESELGQGCTFSLILKHSSLPSTSMIENPPPLSEAIEVTSSPSPTKNMAYAPLILIAEDHPDMQLFIHQLLSPHFKLILCKHGKQAHDYLTTSGNKLPDLIISDIMMPQMDGFTLLKYCKEQPQFSSIPMIMLTARSNIKDRLSALRMGVDDYLTKPFIAEELLARVHNLLSNANIRQQALITTHKDEVVTTSPSQQEVPSLSPMNQKWLKEVEQILWESVTDPDFSVETLAEAVHLGRSSLYRKLKKLTGLTPAHYIREVRLNIARDLLEQNTYETMAEVAYASGFSTPYHFSNIYEKRFGKKPTDYF